MRTFTAITCAALVALSHLQFCAAETSGGRSGAGYSYRHDIISEIPWSIHILKIDRSDSDLQLQTILAGGDTFGLTSLHDQVRLLPRSEGRPIAAINGDFYERKRPYAGDPKGLQIMRGELVSAPSDWSCVWIKNDGEAALGQVESKLTVTWPDGTRTKIGLNERRLPNAAVLYTSAVGPSTRTSGGREYILEPAPDSKPLPLKPGEEFQFRVKNIVSSGNTGVRSNVLVLSVGATLSRSIPRIEPGAKLSISTETSPSIKGAVTGISGGPALLHEGKIVFNRSQLRHPRAAFGWSKSHFYFVEVDGRQPDLSLGMTYNELAKYMLNLGCEEALNLDGGGSATLWVLGQIMNSPCEGRERSVANALILVQKPKSGKAESISPQK